MNKDQEDIQEYTVEEGSGNVFADLNLPNPEERLRKANLAHALYQIIKERALTQKEAANLLGITQSQISDITRGHLARFSIERLIRLLERLGCKVEINVFNITDHPRHTWRNDNNSPEQMAL